MQIELDKNEIPVHLLEYFELVPSYKPKDLMMIPARVAFVLQADGWWLRSEITWIKGNPMPESVTDRPTKATEKIFLLSKLSHYFYDADAVREPYAESSLPRAMRGLSADNKWSDGAPGSTAHSISQARPNAKLSGSGQAFGGDGHKGYVDANGRLLINPAGRNLRDWWYINTKPFKDAHFAVFPPEIPECCIKAGTSEKGRCPKCGAPWKRIIDKSRVATRPGNDNKYDEGHYNNKGYFTDTTTIGWQPTCDCNAGDPVPCVVLDPFSGAGTSGVVAVKLGRDYIGIDLNAEYNEMARQRIADAQLQMRMPI